MGSQTSAPPAEAAPVVTPTVEATPAESVMPPPPAPPFVIEPEVPPKAEPETIVIGAGLPASPAAPTAPPFLQGPEPINVGWEQRLGARAFLWVGAITLALAAIFLVRYSIEEGYLSPEVRVILAALFGFALIAGAERLRPRDDRVSQALAAAGVAALYGSLLSAVALYGMISKVAAGGGAAALTAFAITLSLRHGIFVAALAFVGGFLSPAIIGSEQPNTPVLFGYLLAIAAGTLTVIRASRLVGAGLGRARGLGAVDRDLDAGRSRPAGVALGRALPGGARRALRLGVVATHAGERESAEGRAGSRLGLAGGHRRPARIGDCAGCRPADGGLACPGGARHRDSWPSRAGRRASSSRPASPRHCRWRRWRCGGGRQGACRPTGTTAASAGS